MGADYWSKVKSNRISRRKAVVGLGAGGLGLAAVSLVGCGGGSDKSGGGDSGTTGKAGPSGAFTTPQDTSAKAQRGGIYQALGTDPINLDFLTTSSAPTTT